MYDGHADAPEAANARHHRLLYLAADVFVLRGKVDHGLHVRHAAEQIFAPRFVSLMQRACVVDVRESHLVTIPSAYLSTASVPDAAGSASRR